MRGKMLWFNQVKDVGCILSDDGERLSVQGAGFADGKRPEGRCVGTPVVFETGGSGDDRHAEDVRFVSEAVPRRARARQSSFRMRF